MIRRVQVFQTSDGGMHANKKDAERIEARLRLRRMLSDGNVGEGGWKASMFEDWMLSQGWALVNVLSDILRRGNGT